MARTNEAIKAIDKLFSNTSVDAATTRADLETIMEHCEVLIESIGEDEDDDDGGIKDD